LLPRVRVRVRIRIRIRIRIRTQSTLVVPNQQELIVVASNNIGD